MKIKLLFTGDFCSKHPQNIKLSDSFNKLADSCDVICLNFEAPLAYGELKSPNNLGLDQSIESPSWVLENNFNVISLANNHMMDYDREGLLETKNSFQECLTIGAGSWNEAYEVKFMNIGGSRIGFFSGTSSDFAALKDKWTDRNKTGCAWINHKDVNKIIKSAKENCDYLIVISHGGVEYMDVPLPEWRDRYRELIDIGVDAIIGSHPHVPQGVEQYRNKPIFYSLGNFFFDIKSDKKPLFWDNGILAIIEIENKEISYQSIPIVRVKNTLSIDTSKDIHKHNKYLSDILRDDTEYMKQVNIDVLRLFDKYKEWMLGGFNAAEITLNVRSLKLFAKAILRPNQNHKVALHQIREESTRWLMARALKLKSKSNL